MNANNSENEFKTTLVKVAPDLLKILQSVGAIGDTFPIKNVVDLFGHYLYKKGLLNKLPDGSRFIDCTDENLAKIFGVSQVNLNDLMLYLKNYFIILPRNLEPCCDEVDGRPSARNGNVDQVDGIKRKHIESHSEDEEEKERRKRFALAVPAKETLDLLIYAPEPYEPRPETPLSFQEYETDPECYPLYFDSDSEMSNSSVESWHEYRIDVESTDIFSIEYEVESLDGSKSGDSVISETDDSDIEEVIGTIIVCQDDSDKEFWADASSDEEEPSFSDDSQSQNKLIKFSDKWECAKCNFLNSVATRFCEKCWQKGPNLWQLSSERLPPSWHRRKNKQLQSCRDQGSDGSQMEEYSSQQDHGGMVVAQPDVGHLCSMCLEWPKTGIIVHGRTSHQVCCFQCASKLWKRHLPCPVCRRRIQRVTRNYVA